jgi:hypothetical protein
MSHTFNMKRPHHKDARIARKDRIKRKEKKYAQKTGKSLKPC